MKPQPDLAQLLTGLPQYLDDGQRWSWQLVGVRKKLRKLIAEFEVTTGNGSDATTRTRYIVKSYHGDRGRHAFGALSRLWRAGFRPPSPFTVVRPIAYIADRRRSGG